MHALDRQETDRGFKFLISQFPFAIKIIGLQSWYLIQSYSCIRL